MVYSITIERVIAFLRADLIFACCWPLPPTATKKEIIINKLFRVFSSLHAMLMISAMLYTIISQIDDIFVLTQMGCITGIISEVPLQIYLYTQQYDNLQDIIYKLEKYCKEANLLERDILQQYVNKYSSIYGTGLVLVTVPLLFLIFWPLINSQLLPFELMYPFAVDYEPMRGIIYFHQTFALYQGYIQVCSTSFLALLVWFSTARFEILATKFRMIEGYSDWRACIQEHQEVLKFTKQVTYSISYLTLSSLGISTIAVVLSGLTFLSRLPFSIKVEYLIVCCSSLTKVFLYAWPADHLMNASSSIADAAYDSLWYNHGVASQKIMLQTLFQTRKPVTVSVPGLVSALCLQHYASYVSTAFSYLTSFRVILSAEDE